MQPTPAFTTLNPQQRAAATYGISGNRVEPGPPLLIIAGAGSGKTKTLAHRVAQLLVHGADPRRILLLTFTRRAAEAMTRRAEEISAEVVGAGLSWSGSLEWSGTFHAAGAKLLRLYGEEVGLDPAFTVLDRSDAQDLMDLVRDDLGFSHKDRRFPRKGTCLAIYSYAVNAQRPLDEVLRQAFPHCSNWVTDLRQLFGAYVAAKQRQSVLDYDDLLLCWDQMIALPEFAAAVGGRFDFVLVDEYQDTNALQARLLLRMKPDGRGLTVVGDDAQAIYGFRAATVRNILDFPILFDPPAAVVTLEQNYRSTRPILAAANGVIRLAPERFAKELFSERASRQKPCLRAVRDEDHQVAYVVERILENREQGIDLREQAVLFRTGHHSAALEIELGRRNIPFVKFGGLKFLETAHVKDVLAVLRWAENPRDEMAAFRVLKLLPGIGPGTARKALGFLHARGGEVDVLHAFVPPAAAAELWPGLVGLLSMLRRQAVWQGQLGLVRRFYDDLLPQLYDYPRARLADIAQLELIAGSFRSRERFLSDLALDPPQAIGDEAGSPRLDDDYLILSTIHSAKGQEWKVVYILNVVDGCIPSDMATGSPGEVEEERRLLYVAMTRARDELHLVHPHRFYVHGQARFGDRYVHAPRSRFIPATLLDLFDHGAAATAPTAGPAPGDRRQPPRVDLQAKLREMWR
ncbi:MAG TPA: ATP-dependent helicase [Geminicoccaceae bacterium]